jgi:hypothetical protein
LNGSCIKWTAAGMRSEPFTDGATFLAAARTGLEGSC